MKHQHTVHSIYQSHGNGLQEISHIYKYVRKYMISEYINLSGIHTYHVLFTNMVPERKHLHIHRSYSLTQCGWNRISPFPRQGVTYVEAKQMAPVVWLHQASCLINTEISKPLSIPFRVVCSGNAPHCIPRMYPTYVHCMVTESKTTVYVVMST